MSEKEQTFQIRVVVPQGSADGRYKSEIEEHFSAPWMVDVCIENEKFKVALHCEEYQGDDVWRICADVEAYLVTGTEKKTIGNEKDKEFSWFESSQEFYPLFAIEKQIKHLLKEGDVAVEASVKIKDSFGLKKFTSENFSQEEAEWTDVILMVADRKFHVNKATLARVSPVFRAMFFGSFKESTADEIVIKEANPDAFEALLQICHAKELSIKVDEIAEILELSDRFDVSRSRYAVEQWLIASNGIEKPERLRLAEKFNFENYMEMTLALFHTFSELLELEEHYDSFGPKVKRAIFRKMMRKEEWREWEEVQIRSAMSNEWYYVRADPNEPVAKLAKKVAVIEGSGPEPKRLKLNNMLMDNNKRLSEYKYDEWPYIHSVPSQTIEINLSV